MTAVVEPPRVHGSEVLAGTLAVAVLLVAWSSVALAHLGRHSVPAVVATSLVALLALAYVTARHARVRVVADPGATVAMLAVGAVAAAVFLPGFPYGVSDKDPGLYVSHAMLISRTGDYATDYAVLDASVVPEYVSFHRGEPLSGVVHEPGSRRLVPVFYHLWPAFLATAHDAFGTGGLVAAGPLVGALAVMLLFATARRVGGVFAATAASLLLATNMLQVWQAKYPASEAMAQFLFLGALCGVVVAIASGARTAAFAAGVFVGASYLARADGLLLVMMAAGALCVLLAARRWDVRCSWFAAGLAVVLPHAWWQAYGVVGGYTAQQRVPPLPVVLAFLAVGFAGADFVGRTAGPRVADRLRERGWQRRVGAGVVVAAVALLALGALRPSMFGHAVDTFADGSVQRSYAEQAVRRLSWFLTAPALVVAVAGLGVVALRRWRAQAWAAVLPALLLLPVYGWHPRVAPRLMWWGRRFVPVVLPGLVLLVAVYLAWLFARRGVRRLLAVGALAALVGVYAAQSWPLRGHREWGGTFTVASRVAAVSGERQGVYLWQYPGTVAPLFAGTTALAHGELSALLPPEEARREPYVRSYVRGFAGQPVYVVWPGVLRPPGLTGLDLAPVLHVVARSATWEQGNDRVPRRSQPVRLDFTVWHVAGT